MMTERTLMKHPPDTIQYRIRISGEAGDGIMTAGDILMKAAARRGYESSVVKSFPSNIRGGYSQTLITVSDSPIVSPVHDADIIFSLSPDAFMLDTAILKKNALLLIEASVLGEHACRRRRDELVNNGHRSFEIPLTQLAKETAGNPAIRSTFILGILCDLLGIGMDIMRNQLKDRFASKGSDVVELNYIALETGAHWAQEHLDGAHRFALPAPGNSSGKKLVLEGNQALALGAVAAGCGFFASYPITPATAIGENLARLLHATGGFAYQAEDEIAALGSVIGASFSGVKAMTATSGPGLSLMQEFIGYASMVELPVVVVDVQRTGPSTGMPTKHSQDDLFAASLGGHGEGQRIVIAPQSVEDCFHATVKAFNCSERYQCPVLLLSDSTLAMTKDIISESKLENPKVVNRKVLRGRKPPDLPFQRYRLSPSGINPMAIPGVSPVTYRATGVEHNEDSCPVNTARERLEQTEKRFRKIRDIEKEFEDAVEWDLQDTGSAPCDICVCAWGFNAPVTREAIASLRKQGYKIAAMYPRLLYPVCKNALSRWQSLGSLHAVFETNFSGQYCSLIRIATGVTPVPVTLARGEPFTPREIVEKIIQLVSEHGRAL